MPFLLSNSGNRKKKSYFHDDKAESAKRREMVKQKLYSEHMLYDDNDADAFLQLGLAPTSPQHQQGQHHTVPHRHNPHQRNNNNYSSISISNSNSNSNRQFSRNPSGPSHIDHSGDIHRKPVRRAYSESASRPANSGHSLRGSAAPPLPPRRVRSSQGMRGMGSSNELTPESPISPITVADARFSPAPSPRSISNRSTQRQHRALLSPSPRDSPTTYDHYDDDDDDDDDDDEDEDDDDDNTEISDEVPAPLLRRPPPSRRRRNTVATQSLQRSADVAMRFGPPRKIKSYYPGANKPRNSNFHFVNNNNISNYNNNNNCLDTSDRSCISKDSSKGSKGGFRRGGLFRRKSGDSDDTEETASSSDRPSSFFRAVRRTNSGLKRTLSFRTNNKNNKNNNSNPSSLISQSDHSATSQKSQFSSGGKSTPADFAGQRQKDEIYQSALARAKGHQAMKQHRNQIMDSVPGRSNLTDQLSKLARSTEDSDAEDDDDKESKSIFSSLISKIENIYDDCS